MKSCLSQSVKGGNLMELFKVKCKKKKQSTFYFIVLKKYGCSVWHCKLEFACQVNTALENRETIPWAMPGWAPWMSVGVVAFFFPPTSTQRNWSKLKCVYVLCGSHLNSSFLHQLFRWSPKNRQRWWRTKKAAASARKRDIGFVQEAAAVALFPYLVAPHCCHSCCCCCCYTCRQSFLCSLGNRACSRVAWFRARRVVCGETDESY